MPCFEHSATFVVPERMCLGHGRSPILWRGAFAGDYGRPDGKLGSHTHLHGENLDEHSR